MLGECERSDGRMGGRSVGIRFDCFGSGRFGLLLLISKLVGGLVDCRFVGRVGHALCPCGLGVLCYCSLFSYILIHTTLRYATSMLRYEPVPLLSALAFCARVLDPATL